MVFEEHVDNAMLNCVEKIECLKSISCETKKNIKTSSRDLMPPSLESRSLSVLRRRSGVILPDIFKTLLC